MKIIVQNTVHRPFKMTPRERLMNGLVNVQNCRSRRERCERLASKSLLFQTKSVNDL